MPKYAVFFNLDRDAMGRFLDNPTDRKGPVGKLAEAAGGRLDAYYWMFGQYDGLAIFDLPDSKAAAAVAIMVGSSGAVSRVETHELIESAELMSIAEKAKSLRGSYTPPGAR